MDLSDPAGIAEYAAWRKQLCSDLKGMVVEQLSLEMAPEFITDDQPLFGRGLELDSIDALELAIGIYDRYQLTLSDGDTSIFSSVNTMADYIRDNYHEAAEGVSAGSPTEAADVDDLDA